MYMPEELGPYFAESARRAIFFSKYEARKADAKQVEIEHLLLGILRERVEPLSRIAETAQISLEGIRRTIDAPGQISTPDPVALELPFSPDALELIQTVAKGRNPDQR